MEVRKILKTLGLAILSGLLLMYFVLFLKSQFNVLAVWILKNTNAEGEEIMYLLIKCLFFFVGFSLKIFLDYNDVIYDFYYDVGEESEARENVLDCDFHS